MRPGTNTIALQVMRWSDGTWLEDQDYWYLSGIFRPVRLLAKPRIHIATGLSRRFQMSMAAARCFAQTFN